MADDPILPVANLLLDCLCETVATRANPPLECCLRYGTEVPQDAIPVDICCAGLGYVRIGDMFPSGQAFPDPDDVGQGCIGQHWAVEMEMGIFRCAKAANCETWTTETEQHLVDRWSLVEASCCFGKRFNNTYHGALSWIPLTGTPLPISGRCSGSTLTIVVQVPGPCCTG